jgi:hypothetical protein
MLLLEPAKIMEDAGEVGQQHEAIDVVTLHPLLRRQHDQRPRINGDAGGMKNAMPEMVFLTSENGKAVPDERMTSKKPAGGADLPLSFKVESRRSDGRGYLS